MKNLVFSSILFLSSITSNAQQTFVPDNNFEQALIDLGYDDVLDDFVLTSNINAVTDLDITWKEISDLTGIEGFSSLSFLNVGFNNLTNLNLNENTSLQYLFCELNELTDIDITNNPLLITLYCRGNQLTDIDLSQNLNLESLKILNNDLMKLDLSNNELLRHLDVAYNKLTTLDLNHNSNLEEFFCAGNQLTQLDVSNNTKIYNLNCSYNQLTALDLSQNANLFFFMSEKNPLLINLNAKNNNNTDILTFVVTGSPQLTCIEVDDADWSTENWKNVDPWVSFSEKCMMSNDYIEFSQIQFYPNPTKGTIYFSEPLREILIYDSSGKLIFSTSETTDRIDISSIPNGIYQLTGITTIGKKYLEKLIKK